MNAPLKRNARELFTFSFAHNINHALKICLWEKHVWRQQKKNKLYSFYSEIVNRVRDRINQLRNRYNLEKRKVDIQKSEGFSNARSTWPLFDNLRFLDGHIRPRKSYKCMGITRRTRPPGRPRRQRNYMIYGEESQPAQYANPVALQHQGVHIKYEHDANNSNATGLGTSSSATGGSGHEPTMYHSGYESYGKLLWNESNSIQICNSCV